MIKRAKQLSLKLFSAYISHQNIQEQLNQTCKRNYLQLPELTNKPNPYYAVDKPIDNTCLRDDIVFVTSRFRSGSTVLWNLFRQINNSTAYYEPFNERQWFSNQNRGDFVDSTHIGVSDYWAEYQGLEQLSQFYREDWIRRDLMMDKTSWQPDMLKYIEGLIEQAKGRPVLQFNRIDFRLPWIKHYFPNAKILHLYRHPRDQWCSFLIDKQLMNKDDVADTYRDAFYLDVWCQDLKKHYPFLDPELTPHPYQRFYLLWKLSFLHGQQFSDISIDYESLSAQPQVHIEQLLKELNWSNQDTDALAQVFKPPTLDKWKQYADDAWFINHEVKCEAILAQYLTNN